MPPPASVFSATVSERSMDYKKYILYVISHDPNSIQAMTLAGGLMEILVQNVQSIPVVQRPRWLDRVPSLYSIEDNKCYVGTFCMDKLRTLAQDPILLYQQQSSRTTRGGGEAQVKAAAAAANQQQQQTTGSAAGGGEKVPLAYGGSSKFATFIPETNVSTKNDPRYSDESKVSSEDFDRYVQMRQMQLNKK